MSDDSNKNSSAYSGDTYDRIHKKTWVRRTAGFLGGATLFGMLGMIGGSVMTLMPPLLAAAGVAGASAAAMPTAAAVIGNIALFGGAAAWLGLTVGADVGSNAGAAEADLLEQRKFFKEKGFVDTTTTMPETLSPKAIEKKGVLGVIKDTALSLFKGYNFKAGLTLAGIFAAFGAAVALSPITAPVIMMMGFEAGSVAASLTTAAALGLFGSTMGIKVSTHTNNLSNAYEQLLTSNAAQPHGPSLDNEVDGIKEYKSHKKHKHQVKAVVIIPSKQHERADHKEKNWVKKVAHAENKSEELEPVITR